MIDCFSALSRIDSLTSSSFSSGNTHPRALLYEKLSKYYLLSSPLWKDEIKDAWLWGDPKNPLNPPSSSRHDFGIDLVALGPDRNYWSCQVKERSTSFSSLSLRDLSTFASASEYFGIPPSRRILFLFSSSLSSNSLFQTEDYKVITEDSMEKEGIDFAPFFEEGALKEAKKENSRLRPYQIDAVEKCMEGFEKEDKGQLIMACGTGKTITGLSIAEEMAKRKEGPFFSLCLVPSIQLLSQTLIYWKKYCAFPFTAQAICSDSGANGEENSPSYLEERNIPRVAKTAEDILSPQEDGFTSLFCTYPSLPKVIEAQKMGLIPAFDICIADEAHRTTSKNLWGKIHFGGLRSKKTLFMTATPRLKEEGEGPSMDDSSFFGRPFFTYSFERAIKENYLSDYRVLLYAVRGGEREEETAGKILASFDSFFTDPSDFQSIFGLEKVKAFSLPLSSSFKTPFVKRAIFFCRTIEESKKVSSHFEEVLKGKGLPEGMAEIKHIDGTEKAREKRRKIEWLKEGEEGKVRVLSNSRCLTEGIDVPSLEAVVFFDPKNSDVDVTQAVGRVIRHSDTKPFGLVVVPVVLGEKETAREAGRNKKYQGLIKILKKLREMDPSLDLALSTERGERKRKERKEEEREEGFSLEGLGEVLDKEIREEIPPSPIRFAFSRTLNLLNSFAEENPKEWGKVKERFSFLKEEKLKEETCLHLLLSPFFSSLALDPLFSFMESFTNKAFKDEKEVLKLQNPGRELRKKFSSFSPFYSSFLKEALGEEKGEEENPSKASQDLLSLLSLLLKRVKKEEEKDPKGPLFDPYSGDGSLLSFFERERKEKGEGEENRLVPYYMAKEKGLSCSFSNSFPKEKLSLLASNLLNFSSLKKEVEGGGSGEKELREAFKGAKETLKEGGVALFISPCLPPGFPLECLDGFSSLYSLSLRGSNGIRKEDAGENVTDERSSVSLLCLVKGEGELKARRMEVGKDLSRKEKIAQAKTLLEEGEWKELEEGRKMGRNILADHICSQAKLFENMHDGINGGAGLKSGEGAWAYVSTAIAGALGVNPNSIYNKLYPEVGDNVKHQLFQQALSKVDKEYEENPDVSSAWLASSIMEAYYTLCEEHNISLKTLSTDGETKTSRSRTFTWQYTSEQTEAFPNKQKLEDLKQLKTSMAKFNIPLPAEQATQLDKLEKEAKAWETEHNAEAKLKQALSANYEEFIDQCDKLTEALASIAKKAGMLAEAGEMGLDICSGLANGNKEQQEAWALLKSKANKVKALKQAIDNLNK